MSILLIADHIDGMLSDHTAKALTAACQIGGGDIHILVAGLDVGQAAEQASLLEGVARVLVADDEAFRHFGAEAVADLVVGLADNYPTILAAATARGKNVLPRIAALLDVMQISDVIEVQSQDTFKRPTYAGNAIQTVQNLQSRAILSIRTYAFSATPKGGAAAIESVSVQPGASRVTQVVSEKVSASDRPSLASAPIVVAGGRALGSTENFNDLIVSLADKMGAAVGATRAAVDAGYAPNDWQVGQTGHVVAPRLYIACGISGAIQHLAGMKESTVIVAINNDPEAAIFQVADYGLVGDLFEILPLLRDALPRGTR